MKRILLLVIFAMTFAGCATDSDTDQLSWADAKKRMESGFGNDGSSVSHTQAGTLGPSADSYRASENF